jgi:hypothetical protein
MYPFVAYSFLPYLPHGVDVVVNYAALKGAHDETIVKRCAVASKGIIPACLLRIPCAMIHTIREKNASNDKDIIMDDTHISYSQLSTVLHEALAGYEHLIAYGTNKCSFLSELINRPFIRLEGFNCPQAQDLKSE